MAQLIGRVWASLLEVAGFSLCSCTETLPIGCTPDQLMAWVPSPFSGHNGLRYLPLVCPVVVLPVFVALGAVHLVSIFKFELVTG